jgi:hypothetical protein
MLTFNLTETETIAWGKNPELRTEIRQQAAKSARAKGRRFFQIVAVTGGIFATGEVQA